MDNCILDLEKLKVISMASIGSKMLQGGFKSSQESCCVYNRVSPRIFFALVVKDDERKLVRYS